MKLYTVRCTLLLGLPSAEYDTDHSHTMGRVTLQPKRLRTTQSRKASPGSTLPKQETGIKNTEVHFLHQKRLTLINEQESDGTISAPPYVHVCYNGIRKERQMQCRFVPRKPFSYRTDNNTKRHAFIQWKRDPNDQNLNSPRKLYIRAESQEIGRKCVND